MNTRRAAWFAIGVVIMALVVIGAVTMVRTTQVVDLIRADQKPNIARAQQTQENTDQIKALAQTIKSCTDPKGKCYRRNQQQTGKVVVSITDAIAAVVAAAVAVCAKQPEVTTTAQAKACIRDELKPGT